MEQQFRQWNAQIENASHIIAELKEKAGGLEADAQPLYLTHIQELENKIVAAKAKIV